MGLNRSIAVVLVLICGLSICIVSTQPVKAQSSQTITIKADGSVDPPIAAVRRDGDVYSLTGNIIDSITVQRDNIVLEGAGYTVQAKADNLVGINIGERSNVTVRNVKIQGFLGRAGILVDGSNKCVISQNNLAGNLIGVEISGMSSNNRIVENNLQNNSEGIELESAVAGSDNIISGNDVANNNVGITISFFTNTNVFGNTLTGNKYGFFVGGGAGTIFSNNTLNGNTYGFHAFPIQGVDPLKTVTLDTSNTVNGKPVYYWVNQKDQTIPSNAGYVALVGCTGIAVQNLTLTGNAEGVFLGDTTNSTISHNTLSNNLYGVNVYASSGNTISENTVTNNENGIGLGSGSSNNSIYGNDITANSKGIFIDGSSGNNIIGNNVTNSATGIYTEYSGINIIYHNNFINNTKQWFDIVLEPFPNVEPISVSTWDNGTAGNYWSDYLTKYPNATEIDASGIGDTTYVIYNNNTDRYPLMKPFSIPETTIPEFPSLIFVLPLIVAVSVGLLVYFPKHKR